MSEEKSIMGLLQDLVDIVKEDYDPRTYARVMLAITELKDYREAKDLRQEKGTVVEAPLRRKLEKAKEGLELAVTRITELEENEFFNSEELTSIRVILKDIKED